MVQSGGAVSRAPRPSSLADVVDLILDKGLVIDAYVRVSALGIDVLTIDARVVIPSVDTYLRFAEAVDRLDLTPREPEGIQDLTGSMMEQGSRGKIKGAIEGGADAVREGLGKVKQELGDGNDSGDGRRRKARR